MIRRVDVSDPAYRDLMTAVLTEHYFSGRVADGYLDSAAGKTNLNDHIGSRYELAATFVLPWLQREVDLAGMSIIEIGSGTGSFTLALANACRAVECYELHAGSVTVARERLNYWGANNVHFHEDLFNESCVFVKGGGIADAVVLYAVLEHMTHAECLGILALAWRLLRPDGVLVVAETPNRFCALDEHTSWLPLFSQLPRAIQVLYAANSPREEFRWAITQATASGHDNAIDAMTRWGSGISFHEFELAIGKDVHDRIVLDGYEPEIVSMVPITWIDTAIESLFKQVNINVHRAFTRRHMYLVAKKPARSE